MAPPGEPRALAGDRDPDPDPDPDPEGDLAALAELDEARLLQSLTDRFLQQRIYTYVGDILVAVNPFQRLPLYEKPIAEKYRSRAKGSLPPHIFAVADRAYQAMLGRLGMGPQNQCIVISGESGAGKTESTKLLLQHLMNLCRGHSQLEQQILQVNPLLEAFGNAQTVMNDNSSRFGKYVQLRFQQSTVRGAKLSEYLLEKSRVVQQDAGERNFHIFYYMFAGLSAEEKEIYGLLDPARYRYIGGHFGTQATTECWKHKYREVCNALDMVGFQEQEQVDMQAILAGVLSLGNVSFQPQESNGAVQVGEVSRGWLKAAAGQFGVQEEELLSCLICTVSVTRGEQIQRLHTQQQAEDARDSIAKVAYGRVFGWIVCKINELLAESVDPDVELREIGILDIFGFENFVVNRFEQLCINLANEQLQHFFNHHIFRLEQAAYREEELPWETIAFTNNQPILDLLLAKPLGLLSLLDEQSRFPQATDKTFVDKLNSSFKGNVHFQLVRGRVPSFSILHYAGKVQYSASGFLEKNRDTLPANIRGLFINSITPLLSVLFTATISRTGTLMPHIKAKVPLGAGDNFNNTRKQSVGAQFRHSLSVLMERMYSATPHFVRCVKPNSRKEPGVADSQVLLQQLRYNGLLETIRIRREGFSWRPSFEDFAQKYRILLIKPDADLSKESCLEILQSTELAGWKCGKSRLFFKYWHQEQLARSIEHLEKAAVTIQKTYRGFCCRRSYRVLVAERTAQARRLHEAAERERNRQVEMEAQAPETATPPVPVPRRRRLRPLSRTRAAADLPLQPPIPRPRSKLTESTPFDNFLHTGPCPALGTAGDEAKKRQLKRGATLRWFRETQARKVLQDDGAFPSWLHGMISRREAENLLMDKPLGCFLVRISQSRPGYTLTYRGTTRCRHYMIEVQPNARYVILGEDRAHASLTDLVRYHRTVGIQPFLETLTVPCGQGDGSADYEELWCLTIAPGSAGQQKEPPPEGHPPTDGRARPVGTAAAILKRMQLQKPRRCQEPPPGMEDEGAELCLGEGEPARRAIPRLYPSIRLAMREIRQVRSSRPGPPTAPGRSCCPAPSTEGGWALAGAERQTLLSPCSSITGPRAK
ncbi:myosin-IIIb-like [Alligator mississippiensis]|uniref:non-specific serine/threonine protein kinase n=1 Tax=Alligator mississippiensis TaxID=8496 RepID=A0A151P0U2_ALLMI|nr:myosin-IIIb-like [Alligator mississippiensis]